MEMVEKVALDYINMVKSASLAKELDPLCTQIEDMLTRLDEFETLFSSVKAERLSIQEHHVNGILGFGKNFEQLRDRIDKLEKFVKVVNANVDEVENSIDTAETELKVSNYSFRNLVIKPLLARANRGSVDVANPVCHSNVKDGEFQPVPIFKTSDYFK